MSSKRSSSVRGTIVPAKRMSTTRSEPLFNVGDAYDGEKTEVYIQTLPAKVLQSLATRSRSTHCSATLVDKYSTLCDYTNLVPSQP